VIGKLSRAGFLGAWLVITIFPLYWIVITSLKSPGDIFRFPIAYWPDPVSFENYTELFSTAQFGTYLVNSLIVSTVAAAAATGISILSAYVLARFEFRTKTALLMAFLVTQMIPAFIALGPLYQIMTTLGLVDNRFGLILVYVTMCIPFCTVMLRGFFENIPVAIEEAAMIDGLSRFGALFRVLLAVMRPGVVAAFIFNFVNCWNELFLSVTLMNSDSNKTIPTALNGFISSFNIDWGSMSAAAVLTILPTMALFAFASRHIVEGLTAGATKG
jgi:multiple sugar transport system permease protein